MPEQSDATNGAASQETAADVERTLQVVPPQKPKPTRALPTDRIAFNKQLELLRAWGVAYEQRHGPVTLKEVADLIKMHPSTVPLANPLFMENHLVAKAGQTGFIPSQDVRNYAQAYQWNPATAGTKLAPALSKSWFAQALMGTVNLQGSMPVDMAITELSIACGASPEYRARLDTLLDYMNTAGLIVREGNQIRRGTGAAAAPEAPAAEPAAAPSENGEGRPAAYGGAAPAPMVGTTFGSTQGTVRFNVSVAVDMEEFKGWQPDRITAFFGGIAAVLAAKAAVEKVSSQQE